MRPLTLSTLLMLASSLAACGGGSETDAVSSDSFSSTRAVSINPAYPTYATDAMDASAVDTSPENDIANLAPRGFPDDLAGYRAMSISEAAAASAVNETANTPAFAVPPVATDAVR